MMSAPVAMGRSQYIAEYGSKQERTLDGHNEVNARKELDRLKEMKLLTPEQADAVKIEKVLSFTSSDLGKRMHSSDRILREFKFSVLAPARLFAGLKDEPGEEVLLQGVIDCAFEENGGWVLIDFKTDQVNAISERTRALEYKAQLDTYAWALESITGKPVAARYIYFFSTENPVKV
jgi:ATP-dependent helicase/nuclease subunit A